MTRHGLPELAAYGRPRLRPDMPILWRDQTTIQIGDTVVIDSASRSLAAWLGALDGRRAPDLLEEGLTIPEAEARRAVRGLLAAGALEDAARIPDALRWAPQPRRDALTREFGAALQCYGDLDTAFTVMNAREQARVAVTGDDLLADLLREALTAVDALGETAEAALTILADAPHPDVPASFDDPLLDRPHLHTGSRGDRALVGPLVIPGRTSCLRCAHLHHRDADPAWPLLSVQWAQTTASRHLTAQDPLLARQAAASALLLVRAWVDRPDDADRWSGFALDLRLPLGEAVRVDRPRHPLCGCAWDPR